MAQQPQSPVLIVFALGYSAAIEFAIELATTTTTIELVAAIPRLHPAQIHVQSCAISS